MTSRATRLSRLAAAIVLFGTVAGCGSLASPPPGCPTEPRAAGTLPDLEALLPAALRDVTVDSGWNCLPASLRSYARHGVTRLEFAGATADEGDGNGIVVAVYRSGRDDPPLQAAWVEEFYEGSARESGRVDNIQTRREPVSTAGEVWRMDALNGLSLQSIVVWQAGAAVRVVIVASAVGPDADRARHDAIVEEMVTAGGVAPDAPASSRGSERRSVLPSAA